MSHRLNYRKYNYHKITHSISVRGCVNRVECACRTAFSVYLNLILKSVLLEKPSSVAFSFENPSSSTNSIVGVPYEPALVESTRHSTTSKLAKVKFPDIVEN